ncbi:hypothetical protein FJQ98_16500 [Lysinibacillus agricola]|uniref:PIR Superfamily Protein n=1 Tax=Lysinibacillus agricola TaxID=2590012 RepID=A0ABX7ALQ7_9BACI|nr:MULTISPECIES: DUF5677 domain-containing protein [Lysinibacillus]KOS61470.1 hypothetical protein AN161_17925 [Lysinibacillus sp. FJAT-14222]QQP10846.1 hypothetical protein FJQ98_16500 [Lysinibacillus agricola]
MDLNNIMSEVREAHYRIYEHSVENKQDINALDQSLIFLSSNAFLELKSLVVLVENKAYHGTYSLCRSILEKFIYMRYILEKDSMNRAEDFQLSNLKSWIEIYEKTKKMYPEQVPPIDKNELNECKKPFISSKDKYKWYCGSGTNSISRLFKYFKKDKYGYYYMKYSGETHGNDSIAKFIDTFKLNYDKEQYDNSEVVYIALEAFCDILKSLIDHYNLKEIVTYSNIYEEYTVKL